MWQITIDLNFLDILLLAGQVEKVPAFRINVVFYVVNVLP